MFAGSERGLSCARTSSTRTWLRASASSRSSADFPRPSSRNGSRGGGPRSRPLSSISETSPASGTSTPTRPFGERESIRGGARASSMCPRSARSTAASVARSRPGSRARERPSATIGRPTGRRGECSTSSRCTDAAASRARAAEHRSRRRESAGAEPGSARAASAERLRGLRGQLFVEPAALVQPPELGIAADRLAVDEDLRHRPAAGQLEQLLAEMGVVVEVDLLVFDSLAIEQRFCADAIAAPGCRIHLNACHPASKTVKTGWGFPTRPVPTLDCTVAGRTYKTEAVVLRSFRLGEADRVLHLYTLDRGRVGAVAKGIRRTKSRFGARLEPLSHVELLLHQGSGELQTVTGVDLIESHHAARENPYLLNVGLVGLEAMLRLFTEQEANARAFRALTRFLDLLDDLDPRPERPTLDVLVLSFQLKLLWLSGYLPHVTSCAECGATEVALVGYSPKAGGAVCQTCSAGSRELSPAGIVGIEGLLRSPLAEAAAVGLGERALRDALAVVT